ncbi:prominin-1-like [Biomphalaria glabrata]|uniref:Prominin-1-like n=1 Tax=Biomphalaria glabrata TaxID=6526 RepID=A0A9W3ABG3_BIOGL|nr:prominin-1-like [Biomphalaria glabrata]
MFSKHLPLFLCLVVALVSAQDVTKLDPETLIEGDNTADKDSNVTYTKYNGNQNYKAGSGSDVGSLGPFYDLARSIIGTSFPGDFPIDLAKELKSSFSIIGDRWQDILKSYIGYAIAIAVGIVFIVLCPIIGMCFCCCRCCGRCGGARVINEPKEAGFEDVIGRRVSIIVLSVITVMAITGSALMFATNEQLSKSFQNIKDKDLDTLDDITVYFDSTINQTNILVNDNFNFTLKVLFRDLDNIGYLLGQPIKDDVIKKSGLQYVYNGIDDMDSDANKLNTSLTVLVQEKIFLFQLMPIFDTFIADLQNTIDVAISKDSNITTMCPNHQLNKSFDTNELPNEFNKSVVLAVFVQSGVKSLTQQSRHDLNTIPERIQNETAKEREELKTKAGDYTRDVQDITKNLQKIRNDFLGKLDFEDLKSDAKSFLDTGTTYEKYRWYAGIGLACITLIISLLLVSGLLCGFFGGRASIEPTERSSFSNHGGNFLTASNMLFFIFGWLLMLVTTLIFVVGAPVEKFACRTLNDLDLLDQVITDVISSNDGKSWLGDIVYPNKGVNLSVAEVLVACKADQAVYKALKMEKGNLFNLTQITDYSKTVDIGDKINQFNVGFDGLNITGGEMMRFIDFMSAFEENMNYTAYNNTLLDNKVNKSSNFLTEIITFINSHSASPAIIELNTIKTNLSSEMINGTGSQLKKSIDNIKQALEDIKSVTTQPPSNTLKMKSDTLKTNLKSIESNLSQITNETFRNSVNSFESRLRKILDTFTSLVKETVENDLGKCTPLWNIYNSILINSLCDSLVGSLNAWWAALGWTIFFLLLSTCTSVVTSKHFFKMRYNSEISSKPPVDTIVSPEKQKSHPFNNQVFHSDNADKW